MDSPTRALPALDEVYDHAPCGLLMTTVQGTIVRVNATFCRWLGYDADDLVDQRRLQDLLTIGGKVFHQTHWSPLLQMQRSVAEVKLDMVHRDGTTVPMLINACRRHHDGMEFDDLAVLVVADRHLYERELLRARQHAESALEAKRLAQQALQRADRRKDEFLATLAHELRNPLAPMRTVLDVLLLKDFTDPQVVWSRDVLQRQVAHLTRLVDDLLDVSRIAEGKVELRKGRVDLAMALERSVEGSRSIIDAGAHTLVVQVRQPAEPMAVDADPTRLFQIVQNLLTNAAKYTPPGGNIWLSAERDDDHTVISVRDSGIGIAAAHLPYIFDIFSQLPPGMAHSQGGLGIGLSLVRALTELHGGTVAVSSAGVGLGSEFVIRLPLAGAERNAPAGDPAGPVATGEQCRVLIIDDNEDAATSLAMVLELEGHTTCTAFDGHAGLKLIDDFSADAVILDVGLPGLNGYEIARLVRRRTAGGKTLLIALTGRGQAQDKQDAKAAGFDFHFTKPVDLGILLTVLNQYDESERADRNINAPSARPD